MSCTRCYNPLLNMSKMLCFSLVILAMMRLTTIESAVPPEVRVSHTVPGDFFIAGMFPFHYSTDGPCTTDLSTWAVELSQTMIFAARDINARPDLLPNVTLGLEIREDCYSEAITLHTVLSLLGENGRLADLQEAVPHPAGKTNRTNFMGAIGPVSSTNSIMAGVVGGLFRLPVVSYLATSDELSDKQRFPYFLRSTPPDKLNVQAIFDTLLGFGWDYVGLIYSLNSYGVRGAQEVQKLAETSGVCLAFSSPIGSGASDVEIQEVVDKLKTFNFAKVVIIFASNEEPYTILNEFYRQGLGSNRTFIGSGAFESLYRLNKVTLGAATAGSIFLPLHYQEIKGFQEYFRSLDGSSANATPWFREEQMNWLRSQNCSNVVQCRPLPSSNDGIFVTNAVYIFAYALHDVLTNTCNGSVECASEITSVGDRFLPYLLRVNFEGADGPFHFGSNGEPTARYTVANVRFAADGTIRLVQVGTWDSHKSHGGRLSIDEPVIWADRTANPPRSTCRELCRPGYIEVPLEQKCCWGCEKCPENAVTLEGTTCVPCEKTHWPDAEFRSCEPIIPVSTQWDSPQAIAMLIVSSLGICLSVLVAGGMIYYRQHPLIKATSRELSAIQIAGLILAFVAGIVILSRPSPVSCHAKVTMIALSFTVTFAPILLKVNRIYRIFKASRKSTKRPSMISPRVQVTIAATITVGQIVILTVSILLNAAQPELVFRTPPINHVELYCNLGVVFIVSCVYNLALITACCYFALRARKVPSNYNESKFIAASVYSNLVFCMAALPVYITATTAVQRDITLCVVVLINAYTTLLLVFLPKLYAVRFVGDIDVMASQDSSSSFSSSTTGAGSMLSRGINNRRVQPMQLPANSVSTVATVDS